MPNRFLTLDEAFGKKAADEHRKAVAQQERECLTARKNYQKVTGKRLDDRMAISGEEQFQALAQMAADLLDGSK